MSLFKYKTIRFFLKNFLAYVLYLFTALTACVFAFSLVVSFLNVSFSEEKGPQPPQKKEVGFKKVFGDIFKNLKTILSDLSEDEENKVIESKETLSSSDTNKEQQPPPVSEGMAGEPAAPPVSGGEIRKPELPASEEMAGEPAAPPVSGGEIGKPELPASEEMAGEPAAPASREVAKESAPEEALPSVSGGKAQEISSEASLEVQSYMAPFVYDPANQKDPFEDPTYKPKPKRTISSDPKEDAVVLLPQTPPEEYSLNEISLKGVIWNNKKPKALFELPNSAGYYSLIKGDKIGKNGVLFEIRESEIVIVETNIIGKGKDKREERVIKIKKMNRLNNKS